MSNSPFAYEHHATIDFGYRSVPTAETLRSRFANASMATHSRMDGEAFPKH